MSDDCDPVRARLDELLRRKPPFWQAPWMLVPILVAVVAISGALGWWVGNTPPRPIDVIVHFDQPLQIQLMK